MTNYALSPHFRIAELVSKQVLTTYGSMATWFIDPRVIIYLEFMRSRFGATYLNNWIDGGNLDSRGFRSPTDKDGAAFSQHRFGRATDTTFQAATPDEIRKDIALNFDRLYKPLGISCIESEVNWVHADMRYIPNQTEILIVKPR